MRMPSYVLVDLVVDEVAEVEEQTDLEGVVVVSEVPGNLFPTIDQPAMQT